MVDSDFDVETTPEVNQVYCDRLKVEKVHFDFGLWGRDSLMKREYVLRG